jgi:hypothetical protein
MILAALLVQMTNPRCQRVHRELDEGVVHRDAMNAHQERPESVLRHRNPAIRGLRGPLREEPRVYDDYVRALLFEVVVSKGTNNKDSL